jgi:hypothetical protein
MVLGISEAVELSGRIVELVKKGATMELQERIMELREAVLNSKEELLRLRDENGELKRQAAKRNDLVFERGVYWQEHEGGDREGPFCQRCQDVDSKLVRLQEAAQDSGWHYWCRGCNGGARLLNSRPITTR